MRGAKIEENQSKKKSIESFRRKQSKMEKIIKRIIEAGAACFGMDGNDGQK